MRFPGVVAHVLAAAAIVLTCSNSFGQERPMRLNHPLSIEKDQTLSAFAPTQLDTVFRVLAVMVQFLPDNDPLTTGNGLFDTSTTGGQMIDPPPHDRTYFQNHLLFLQNYWRRVTNATLIVNSDLVDTVIQLQHPMRYYSPPPGSINNRELAVLVDDTWKIVDSLRPSINFSQYQAFCIFHAGVGRDIDLVSLLGFDPTPFDLPSVYIGLAALQRNFGPGYPGVPVQGGSFFVTNSMILPETESRLIPILGGQVLLQLGINGLLAASLGSHLGLPDLFDTRSGRSGIGRFGLMDGQAIFSWNGVFPPEPSAWEKYFLEKKYDLGMLEIVNVPPGQSTYSFPAVSISEIGRDTIGRVSISSKEYFLVENRNRDARGDSAIVWRVVNNTVLRQAFYRDAAGFNAFDQSNLFGDVIDVDEFDFSLPGGVRTSGEFFDGGILVWHIDENVIDAGYASNSVNADLNRRGIDLEEADGPQDIGQIYGFLDPGSGSESGIPQDFWFRGNDAPPYRNEFSSGSYPNSFSNAGANSHITIKDFSPRSPRMSVTIQRGDSLVQPLPGYPRFVGKSSTDNSPQFLNAVFLSVGDSIFAFKPDSGVSATRDSTGIFSRRGGRFPIVGVSVSIDTTILIGVQDSVLEVFYAIDGNVDGVFDSVWAVPLNLGARLTTSPVIRTGVSGVPRGIILYAGDEVGKLHRVSIDGSSQSSVDIGTAPVTSIAIGLLTSGTKDSAVAVAGNILKREDGLSTTLPVASAGWQVAAMENRIIVADVGGATLLIFDKNLELIRQISVSGGFSPLAIGDIDADGKRDIVFAAGDRLYVFNQAGAAVDYFPLALPAPASGAPVIARLGSDRSQAQILVATANGLVAAYDTKGKMHTGFPLATAGTSISTPAIFALPTPILSADRPALYVADNSGFLTAWRLQSVPFGLVTPWGSYRGNIFHTGSDTTGVLIVPPPSEFFPASSAYNWPNPVYNGKTYIRYFVSENAIVRIKIFDLSGELVDELSDFGIGGLDNDVEWVTSGIQSGIYFGRIEAQAGDKHGSTVIKIAVVK